MDFIVRALEKHKWLRTAVAIIAWLLIFAVLIQLIYLFFFTTIDMAW